MEDEVVKLIIQVQDNSKKNLENLKKRMKELDKETKSTGKEFDDASKKVKGFGNSSSKASRDVKDLSKDTGNLSSTLGKISVVAGAAAGALTLMAFEASNTARELQGLADIAGVNVEDFNNLASTFESFGIQSEGLASVLKDVTERIDDAVFNNAGEFIDVARQLNIELTELQKLKPEEQLELLIQKLNGQGLNRARSITDRLGGDELIKLEALYRRNREEVEQLQERVNQLDFSLTEEEIQSINEVRTEFDLLLKNIGALLTQRFATVFEGADSILKPINEEITKIRQGTSVVNDIIENGLDLFKLKIDQIVNTFNSFATSLQKFGTTAKGVFFDLTGNEEGFNKEAENLANLNKELNILGNNKTINELYSEVLTTIQLANTGLKDLTEEEKKTLKQRKILLQSIKDENLSVKERAELIPLLSKTYKDNIEVQKKLNDQSETYIEQTKKEIEIDKQKIKAEEERIKSLKELNELKKQPIKIEKETISNFDFGVGNSLLDQFENLQVEILRLQGRFVEAFDIEQAPINKQIKELENKLKEFDELAANNNITKSLEEQAQKYREQIELLKQKQALLRLEEDRAEEEALLNSLSEGVSISQEQFDLGFIDKDQLKTQLDDISTILSDTFNLDNIQVARLREEINLLYQDLDTFGQISLSVFEDFSQGAASAFTDVIISGGSLRDSLGSVFQSIAQQLLQAVIQAVIFSAILSGLGIGAAAPISQGGQGLNFGQLFEQNLTANLTGRHNEGSAGRDGDTGNFRRKVDLFNPSRNLAPQERLMITKTDETVIKTNKLNSPTGVGSNEVQQPQLNINNYVVEDEFQGFLMSDKSEDTIINIVNRNRGRLTF